MHYLWRSYVPRFLLCFPLPAGTPRLPAQVQTEVAARHPRREAGHRRAHQGALARIEGNLEGESADRDVIVFLPPSYNKDKHRRYPVVYALHGYSIGAEQWTHEIHVPQTIEGAFAQGAKEMIVVLPDSKTGYGGSMYSSSVTTGDFEKFIAHDLVAYIDAHYRTLPNRLSRGLVGHSMGGYGASRIGMKHPDVFGSLYIMSPCCMSPRPAGPPPGMDAQKYADAQKQFEAHRRRNEIPRRLPPTCPSSPEPSWPPPPPGPPTRRIPRSTSTCP